MRISSILASIAAALLTAAPSDAQAPPAPVALTAEHIDAPDAPTEGNQHDIFLSSDKPLNLLPPLSRLTRIDGTRTLTVESQALSVKPDCLKVTKDKPCRIAVILGDVEEPGRYVARLTLAGEAGGRREVKLDFARRRPIECAILLVVAGLLAGVIVASWRGGGRERARRVIAIKEAIEILDDLDRSVPPFPRMGPVIARAREMEAALLRAAPVDDAELAELQLRVSQYRFLRDIEARAANLPGDKRPLNAAIDDAIDLMEPRPNGKLAPVADPIFQAVRDRFEELEGAANEAMIAAGSQAMPTDPLPLPVTQAMSARSARRAYMIAEWVVAFVLWVVFVVVALGTLYVNNAYWGSYTDLLAAFMIGFGAYAGAVASVDSFIRSARTAS